MRRSVGFTCACIYGKYILVGTTSGSVLVADIERFEFIDAFSIQYPRKHRENLDLRANALNKLRLSRSGLNASGGSRSRRGKARGQSSSSRRPPREATQKRGQSATKIKRGEQEGWQEGGNLTPVVWIGITGPQIVKGMHRAKIIVEYADGTVCLHSPLWEHARKGEEARAESAETEEDRSNGDEILTISHSRTGALYCGAFAKPVHSKRIFQMSNEGLVEGEKKSWEGGSVIMFSAGSDQTVHLWKMHEGNVGETDGHLGGLVAPPSLPIGVIDIPKSLNEKMSYMNFGLGEGLCVGDWCTKGGRFLMNSRWERNMNYERMPQFAVCSMALNNNGTEVAVGCANGYVKIYDLSGSGGSKLSYSCDTKTAALGHFEESDERMKTPPTLVTSLKFEGTVSKADSNSIFVSSTQRNSQHLVCQHSSGWASVMSRSSCFKGGEVVNEFWHERMWSHTANISPGKPSSIALIVSDEVDAFSIVNEGGAGTASSKHSMVRRLCRSAAAFDRKGSKTNCNSSGLWVFKAEDKDGGEGTTDKGMGMGLDWPGLIGGGGNAAPARYKGDGVIVGAEVHPSEQYLIFLTAKGTVFIYHLWLVEVRGIFPVVGLSGLQGGTAFLRSLKIDPWGLYVAVGVGKKVSMRSEELAEEESGERGAAMTDGFICGVEFFEIATGKRALLSSELKKGFDGTVISSSFEWSSNGDKLVFMGCRGNLETRLLPTFMVANMADLKRQLRVNSSFWSTFPMYVGISPQQAMALSASGRSRASSPQRSASRSKFSGVLSGGIGSIGTASSVGMGSRVKSKDGFATFSDISQSDAEMTASTSVGVQQSYRGVPKMSFDREDDKAGKLYGESLGKNGESKSTLFGRHSEASSMTA